MPETTAPPTADTSPHSLTPPQVAEILNVSRVTAWRLMRSGRLPSYLVGRVRRVRRAVVDEFIARQERATAERAA